MDTGQDTELPRLIAWCHWHDGLSDTARLMQVGEAGNLFACERCRIAHGLVPLAERQ